MKNFILMVCLCLAVEHGLAQTERVQPPKLAVKWSPLHLIYKYPSLQVAVEYHVGKNVSLQYDAGLILPYVPPHVDSDFQWHRRPSGFRGMAEVRYYIPGSPRKVPFYFAAEFFHSHVSFSRYQTIGRNCDTGDCDYYEYAPHGVEVTHLGGAGKFGILLFPRWPNNKKFFFDFNAGLGMHDIVYSEDAMPAGAEPFASSSILMPLTEETRLDPRLVLGVRLCYIIL